MVVDHDGTCVVSVAGQIDLYTAPELQRQILAATANGSASLMIDLSERGFIDSTALGVLIRANRCLDGSGRLALISDDRNIRKVFEITGLDRLFAIYRSRAVALNEGRL